MTNPLDQLRGMLPSLLEQKGAEVAEKARSKQEYVNPEAAQERDAMEMDSNSYAAKYGEVALIDRTLARHQARIARSTAASNRFLHEKVEDTVNAAGSSAVALAAGVPLLAADLTMSTPAAKLMGMDKLRKHTTAPGMKLLGEFLETERSKRSVVSQADEMIMNAENQAGSERSEAQLQAEIVGGEHNVYAAGLRHVGREAADWGGNLLDHPTSFANILAEQAPTMGMGAIAGAITRPASVALRAEAMQVKAVAKAQAMGMSGRAAGSELAKQELLSQARNQLVTRNMMGLVSATETGSAYSEIGQEIQRSPIERLAEMYPEKVAEMQAQNLSEGDIRAELTAQVGLPAAATVAPLAFAAARLGAGVQLNPLGRAGAGSVGARVGSAIQDGLGEVVEESLQGGTSALATNAAKINAGNTEVDVLDNVGGNIGIGAVAAMGMTAGMRAPGIAAAGVVDAARAAGEVAPGILKTAAVSGLTLAGKGLETASSLLEARAAKSEAAQQAQTEPEQQARQEHLSQAEALVRTAVPESAPSALIDEDLQKVMTGEQSGGITGLLDQAAMLKNRAAELSAVQRRDLSLAIQRTGRQMLGAYNEHFRGISPEERAQLDETTEATVTAFESLLGDEELSNLINEDDPETVTLDRQVMERIESAETPTEQDIERAMEISYSRPELVTEKAAEQLALFQRTKGADASPNEAKHVAVVSALAPALKQHATQAASIQERVARNKDLDAKIGVGNSGVTVSAVTNMIQREGFDGRRSLVQYARDISKAASVNDTEAVAKSLDELMNFGRHFQEKAQALDGIATTAFESLDKKQIDKGHDAPFRQLRNDGSLSEKASFIIPGNERSTALIDQVYNDANTIIAQYNHMARTYLGASAPQLDLPGSPKYHQAKATYDQSTAGPVVAPSTPARAAPAVVAAPVVAAPGPSSEAASTKAEVPTAAEVVAAPAPAVTPEVVDDTSAADAAALAEILAEAQRALAGEPARPAQVTGTLDEALDLDDAAYLEAINPGSKVTPESESDYLVDEIREEELPERAEYLKDVDGISYFRDDNFVYAVDALDGGLVGQAATSSTGTTLAVLPEFRRSQIKADVAGQLMAETLRDNPFVPAGSLTEGAKKTRLRALALLRAERAEKNAPSVVKRFAGLRPEALSSEALAKATPEEKLKSRNRLLTAFTFNENGSGLFARLVQPIQQFTAAFEALRNGEGPQALRDLLPERYRTTHLQPKQIEALETITTKHVPAMVKKLNDMLAHASTGKGVAGAKGFLDAMKAGTPSWHLEARLGLFATNWGRDKDKNFVTRYQPEIAQAMALAAIQWANRLNMRPPGISEAAIQEKYPDASAETRAAMMTMHLGRDSAEELGQTLMGILGLSPNRNESPTYLKGIPAALGLEAINMLEELGWIAITEIAQAEGSRVTTSFITVPEDSPIVELSKELGGDSLLPKLLTPDEITAIEVGAPSTASKKAVQGTRQPLSEEQLANQARAQQQAHTFNFTWLNDIAAIGLDNVRRLRGYQDLPDITDKSMNKNDRAARDGVNQALMAGYTSLIALQEEIQEFAKANNLKPEEVPLHFSWRTISSMRSMMNQTLNPQGNKDVRELVSPHAEVLDLTNADNLRIFKVAVAQALGVKTEKNLHEAAIAQLDKKLEGLDGVLEAWTFLHETQQQGDDVATAQAGAALNEALMDSPLGNRPIAARELNALSHYARYLAATQTDDGLKTFQNQLALEADGKTDGMFNAMVHFGLHALGPRMLTQLRQGGLFIGQMIGSLNEDGGEQGDLYLNVTSQLTAVIRKFLKGTDPKEARKRTTMEQAVRLLSRVGEMTITNDEKTAVMRDLVVERSLGKEPMTQSVYGAGMASIMRGKAEVIAAHVYQEMTAALADGTELPPELIENLRPLMLKKKKQGTKEWEAITPPNLRNVAGYATFSFSSDQLQALADNLSVSVGKQLGILLDDEMGPVFDTFDHMYALSGLQGLRFIKAYRAEVAKRRAELIAAGELLPTEGLSPAEEAKIEKALAHLKPVYGTVMGGKIDLTTKEDGEAVTRPRKVGDKIVQDTVRARGISGGKISLPITQTGHGAPGVRAAALVTQGGGDASMMQRFGSLVGTPDMDGTLDVFDGLEMMLSKALTQGRLINQASLEALMFDLLGDFEKVAAGMDSQSVMEEIMSDTELALEVFGKKQLRDAGVAEEDLIGGIIEGLTAAKLTVPGRAALIRATKLAIAEQPVSNDHMATTNTPYTLNGGTVTVSESDESLAARINARAQELLYDEAHTPIAQPDPALAQAMMAEGEIAGYDKAGLKALVEKVPLKGKVHAFLFERLFPLMPADMQVFVGTPAQIQTKKAELFPERLGELGTGQEPGLMVNGTVFLTVASPETLVHELVHVVTQDLLQKFYQRGGKGLTDAQRGAILQIEKLAQAFAELSPERDAHPMERDALEAAQETVNALLEQNTPQATAAAVNEFLAWSLTNGEVARVLKRTKAPTGVMRLAQQARDWVRKLLGLPSNPAVMSFFEATLGNFIALTEQDGPVKAIDDAGLFQRIGGVALNEHDRNVATVYGKFRDMLMTLPDVAGKVPGQAARTLLVLEAETSRNQLKDIGGMKLSASEELAFDSIHAVLSSDIPLDAVVLQTLSSYQAHALGQLKYTDLLADPKAAPFPEHAKAVKLLGLLRGQGLGKDNRGRSLMLANFVAMAQTHAPLRRALLKMEMPKQAKLSGTLDSLIRQGMTKAFNWGSNRSMGLGNAHTPKAVLDVLTLRLEKDHQRALEAANVAAHPVTRGVDRAETVVKDKAKQAGNKLRTKLEERKDSQAERTRGEKIVQALVSTTMEILDSPGAIDGVLETLNEANLPTAAMELVSDAIGSTPLTQDLYALLNRVKHVVATARQRLREEVPAQVRSFFKTPLTAAQGKLLHATVARTDLQVLLGNYSLAQINTYLTDDTARDRAIQNELGQLKGNVAAYETAAKQLAVAMVKRTHAPRYRNVDAMARLLDQTAVSDEIAEHNTPVLDRLVTLMSLAELTADQQKETVRILEADKEGTRKLLQSLQSLVREEQAKNLKRADRYNGWKGYVPESRDPRSHVVLATPVQAADLVKRGYRKVAPYTADQLDIQAKGLAYYAIDHAGGPATYVQGVLQTVSPSFQGMNLETGLSLDPNLGTSVRSKFSVATLRGQMKAKGYKDSYLAPLYDGDGNVVGFERVLDPALLENHLKGDSDLAVSIGSWMGRQMEEKMAAQMNREAVKAMRTMYDRDSIPGRKTYIDLSTSKDPVHKDIWNAIPKESQQALLRQFEGQALVRPDMLRNLVGYRMPSVGDLFTGLTQLPEPVRKQAYNVAVGLLGPDAYRKLVAAERAWEGAVGTAKDFIVVRSGVVALGNTLSNVLQLMAHGVPVLEIPRLLARKAQETEIHLRNEKRLAQLTLQLQGATDSQKNKLQVEANRLLEENRRLSIAPLIDAGELPTIAEGLTEQDQFNYFTDLIKQIERKVGELPAPMVTAAKVAVISRDTAIYQGLNRIIQFGDFTAKAVIYDRMIAEGKTPKDALAKVSERFVNYNRNAGRTRDKLESLGLLWFWNYKVRIQKVVLSTLRENPLRLLASGLLGDATGMDTLMSTSVPAIDPSYSVGTDMFWRSHEMVLWRQIFG